MKDRFVLSSQYAPAGDQPQAIEKLAKGIIDGKKSQVLLGVTGSGKTFTMANIIEKVQKPTLILAHNKTLAAQLCSEFKEYFPDNAVEFFVSYYDYYQPEAYIEKRDLYIEKDSSMNEEIDRMRHSATSALLERRDVIVVASVSCIYGIGAPEDYKEAVVTLRKGQEIDMNELMDRLISINFKRNDIEFNRGCFRVRGDTLEVFPMSGQSKALRIEFFGDEIDRILETDALTGKPIQIVDYVMIFPATHYAIGHEKILSKLPEIREDMVKQAEYFRENGKLLEAERILQRTTYDIEMLQEIGSCPGIENYSRYFDGRKPGEPPYTLMDFFPDDYLLIVDESHVTLPQVRGMYNGDHSRKEMLIKYGFRLPAAADNRPLKFDEFNERINQAIYCSATPAPYERELSEGNIVEQIVRPTGLVDPEVIIRPVTNQLDDLLGEIKEVTAKGFRVLVTTLTKKLAERLTDYLGEMGINVRYMHSDIDTIERIDIIRGLRLGEFDVLVGINLLREGLDIPEVALVAILDADKEGFLRNETSLIQTIGRAARNAEGRVILYADVMTDSIKKAVGETNRRRKLQQEFNEVHGITPKTIIKAVADNMNLAHDAAEAEAEKIIGASSDVNEKRIQILEQQMKEAAAALEFEIAAILRDKIKELKKQK
ncbi:MAG: excinuclease ABC subunit UvrB [Clostridia bacterium]|nr:excinuclease ABC subunit UvrB [Clostridia bacterium]MBQ5957182.1 excinuclease ABC subunit UvrB [Clostridia bacterium]MBR0439048.1 excinuclease ABC subunit UvrB [Clostridia bacterium]MBR3563530.1 excinuclease ABC subunit UvrB [Clostridia bacterium]MBR6135711.1 excinuclease ABC subunit UvrB [Clostridia bacterium]